MAARKQKKLADVKPEWSQVTWENGVRSSARWRWVPFRAPVSLITLGPDAVAWTSGGLPDMQGAIVRLLPPADVSDDRIEAVTASVRQAGAVATKLLARAAGDQAVTLPGIAPPPVRRRQRDVVLELVGDRPALATLVGSIMDQEGL